MNLITRIHHQPCLQPLKLTILLLFIALVIPDLACGQQMSAKVGEKEAAVQHLMDLKQSTLIFILRTEQQQLDVYEKLIDSPTASLSEKKRAAKIRQCILDERLAFKKDLAKSIYEAYDFTDFRIINDYDVKDLRAGKSVQFLDDAANPDASIKKPNGPLYFAREQYINPQDGARVLSIVVLDDDMNVLSYPLPSIKLTSFPLPKFISGKTSDYRSGKKIIEKLNRILASRYVEFGGKR